MNFDNNLFYILLVDEGFINEHDDIINSFYNGIEENSLSSFSTYPNPASSILNLINVPQGAKSYVIYDALGNSISNTKIGSMIDVNGLKQGLYFLKIVGLKSEYVTRFVKI